MTKIKFKILILLFISSISGSCIATSLDTYVECFCSVIKLVSSPEKYDGRIITASGVVGFIHNEPFIFLSTEHERLKLIENAIKIEVSGLNEDLYKKLKKSKGKYVEVYGKFQGTSFSAVRSIENLNKK